MAETATTAHTMTWDRLLTKKRFGDAPGTKRPEAAARSAFEADYDRVIFSTPFRRLQDKTQVIPLPTHDFVHTRLTHSLEVSCVGRSLGKSAGKVILDRHPYLAETFGITIHDFGAIIATAALAHDIGNPPFGHSGEKAISEYFTNGAGKRFRAAVDDAAKWADLTAFEGNANGFRTLVNASTGAEGGLRLTYPTLAAFTKYPKASLPQYPKGRASEKKFGFFQNEVAHYQDIADSLGLIDHRGNHSSWCRHPLAFLVEAADDICYSIIDFEDGLCLGLIDERYALEMLLPIIGERDKTLERYHKINGFKEKVSWLRAVTINTLTRDVVRIFLENEKAILNGSYDRPLIDDSPYSPAVEAIKERTFHKVYRSRNVLEIESAGFTVMDGLLEYFITAVNDKVEGRNSWHSKKNFDLLPNEYPDSNGNPPASLYDRILMVCDFISGMTDSGAIALYRKMNGIDLPVS